MDSGRTVAALRRRKAALEISARTSEREENRGPAANCCQTEQAMGWVEWAELVELAELMVQSYRNQAEEWKVEM